MWPSFCDIYHHVSFSMKALQPCTVSEDVEVRWVGLRSSEGWAPEPTGFIFIYLITLYKYLDYIHITWITICHFKNSQTQTSTIFQHSVQLCMAKAVLQIFGTDLQPAGVLDRSFCSFHWYLCDFYALWYTVFSSWSSLSSVLMESWEGIG